MNVHVFGENELIDRIHRGRLQDSHCISIRDPGEQLPDLIRRTFAGVLELKFYDADSVAQLGPAQVEKRIPTRLDVKGVVEFYNLTRGAATGYTVHCWQGQSRSPAVALGLLFLITGSEEEASQRLRRMRPQGRPHQLLVRLFDEVLGCNLTRVNVEIRRDALEDLRREIRVLEQAAGLGDPPVTRPSADNDGQGPLARAAERKQPGG